MKDTNGYKWAVNRTPFFIKDKLKISVYMIKEKDILANQLLSLFRFPFPFPFPFFYSLQFLSNNFSDAPWERFWPISLINFCIILQAQGFFSTGARQIAHLLPRLYCAKTCLMHTWQKQCPHSNWYAYTIVCRHMLHQNFSYWREDTKFAFF